MKTSEVIGAIFLGWCVLNWSLVDAFLTRLLS